MIECEFSRRLDGSEMPDREAAVRRQPDPARGPSARTYLLIVLGEYVLADENARAWTQTIIDALALLDFDERAARQAIAWTAAAGWLRTQVIDNDDGIVMDYGAAPDGSQLAPAIKRVARHAGRVPRAVTADRGYGQAAVERDLHAAGVRTVAISRQATTSPARKALEHGRGFRRLVRWRTGCEGRISYLKRRYGWDRTRLDGKDGAAIWCGHGIFTHNLVKISALAS